MATLPRHPLACARSALLASVALQTPRAGLISHDEKNTPGALSETRHISGEPLGAGSRKKRNLRHVLMLQRCLTVGRKINSRRGTRLRYVARRPRVGCDGRDT